MSPRTSRSEQRFYNYMTMIFALPVMALVAFWTTWWAMLALGAAHGLWPAIPAMGYWTTYLILVGITGIVGVIRWNPNSIGGSDE